MDSGNSGIFKIVLCDEYYLVQHLITRIYLLIQHNPLKISNYNSFEYQVSGKQVIFCQAILGLIQINGKNYLIFTKKVEKVGIVSQSEIFEIKEVEFLPIPNDTNANIKNLDMICDLKHLLSKGFYFSNKFDLTISFQKQSISKSKVIDDTVDKNFFWNIGLYKEFIDSKIDNVFYSKMIYGYVGIKNFYMKNDNNELLSFIIISRKLTLNPYKFNYTQGINIHGHVANYIETEQIMIFKNYQFSFVQSRGTLPLFYEIKQKLHKNLEVVITKPFEITKSPFMKHLKIMIREYKFIFFLNCLNVNNDNEKIFFSDLNSLQNIKEINMLCKNKFVEFEIDEENKLTEELDKTISSMIKLFDNFGYFCYDINEKKVLREQFGIIRTSCLDSSTKSFHMQKNISKKIFEIFVKIC